MGATFLLAMLALYIRKRRLLREHMQKLQAASMS